MPVYSNCVYFPTSCIHIDSNKFILWSNFIPLSSIDTYIHSHFSCDVKTDMIKKIQCIAKTDRDSLLLAFVSSGITPPILSNKNNASSDFKTPEGRKRKT